MVSADGPLPHARLPALRPEAGRASSDQRAAARGVVGAVVLVLLRMTGELWPSAWVAALFAIHPLHVESVAWVAERRDVLSGLFFMLTLGAYALYAERPSLRALSGGRGCFALGLMAKPMLVTLPCVLLLLDYWPLGRFRPSAAANRQRRGSWLAGCRLPGGWWWKRFRCWSCRRPMHDYDVVSFAGLVGQSGRGCRWRRGWPMPGFLRGLPGPVILSRRHGSRSILIWTHLPSAWVAGSLALLVAITAVAYCWRRRPYLVVGWLWFLGMLVPVIGLIRSAALAMPGPTVTPI